jgi:hypothetical protein
MLNCELAIVYQPVGGDAVELARVFDRRLLVATAQRAISDRARWAGELAKQEPGLAVIERAEVDRLRSVLSILIPDLATSVESPARTTAMQ